MVSGKLLDPAALPGAAITDQDCPLLKQIGADADLVTPVMIQLGAMGLEGHGQQVVH
jgi:hypothetical protein